jgi:molybdate transport system substrate-binding protein
MMVICLMVLTGTIQTATAAGDVTLFAAASTTNAITDIGKLFSEKGLGTMIPSFASSSTLAKQIESGAPAELYLSANEKWMNYLEERDLIVSGSRMDLLSNRIVLIVPADSATDHVEITNGFKLADLLGDGYLAMGDPDHVPAGIYGKQALEALGVWSSIDTRIARQKDVRSALALVERGESPLGVVYATDAAISDKVRVVGLFPEESHPKIVYPVAIIKGCDTPTAKAFMKFLTSDDARAVFESYGFSSIQ